ITDNPTIATMSTSRDAPISPTTIPSIILENLLTFNSAFRFDERLRSLETTFSEYRQTNPFVDAVSAIPENDEFLRNIDENMKKIIKEQVKSQVKEQVSRILPRIEESVNATLEAEEGPSARSDRGSKRQREGREHASASTPSETATGSVGRSTIGSQSRQLSASESAFAEEPVQTTCQMEEPSHPVFETGSDDQPIVQS
nr:hypothetical protein [Tanacetum cinerariifolium]